MAKVRHITSIHTCAVPTLHFSNATIDLSNGSSDCSVLDSCEHLVFDENLNSIATEVSESVYMQCTFSPSIKRSLTYCIAFEFKFRLYCHRAFATDVVTAIQMAGVLVGAFAWGQLSELFGRKSLINNGKYWPERQKSS